MSRKGLITAILALVVVIGAGVGLTLYFGKSKQQENIAKFEETSKSAQNIIAEEHFPKDISMLLSLNLKDKDVRENLDYLLTQFPGTAESKDRFVEELLRDMNSKMKESNVDFEADVKPAFAEGARVIMGMKKNAASGKTPEMFVGLYVSNVDAFKKLKDKALVTSKEYVESLEQGNMVLRNPANKFYAMLKGDIFFITNSDENLKSMMNITAAQSLYDVPGYKKVLSNLETPHLVYMYMNFPLFFEQMIAAGEADEKSRAFFESDSVKMLEGMGMSLTPKKDGVSFKLVASGNQEAMDKLSMRFSTTPNSKQYMTGKFPALNTIMYEEIYNLKEIVSNSFRSNPAAYSQMAEGIEMSRIQIQQALNLDLQKDFFDLFDKGFALAVQYEKGNLIPGLSILVDAKGHEESARKVLAALDLGMIGTMASIRESTGSETFLTKEAVQVNGQAMVLVKLNLMEALQDKLANIPPAAKSMIEKMKVEFVYGLDANGVMVLSTIGNLSEKYGKSSLTSEPNIKQAWTYITADNQGAFYFDLQNVLAYAEEMVKLIDQMEPMSATEKESYDRIVNMLKPIRYAIFSSQSGPYDSVATGFIKIGE